MLDLFGSEPAPSCGQPDIPPAPSTGSRLQRPAAKPGRLASPGSPKIPSPEPRLPPNDEAAYRHPRATREALLGSTRVAYAFRRSKRRTIGFCVGAEGLVISAPKWVPLSEIDQAVQNKSDWILQKLQAARERHCRLESARMEWRDGAALPFQGELVTLVMDPLQSQTVLRRDAPSGNACLRIALSPGSATPEQIQNAVQVWLMHQARLVFTERLDHFAPQLGVQWQKLSLSSAATRWGSARANGAIRLNWRLLHFRPAVLDYVVVHELSHLRVMDHSPRFWATVGSLIPDYASLRRELREEVIPRG